MQPKVEFIFLTPPVKHRGFGSGIEVIGFSITSLLKIRNIEMENASPVKYLFMKCMGWRFPADGAMNTKWPASTKRLSKSFHCWPTRKAAAPANPISAGEFWFLFLHILNGRMATLPQALPRSFRDLHVCFRESKFKTAASASFRGVDIFTIFLEVLPQSHRELPRKLFVGRIGVEWKCAIWICWWAGHSDNVFGCTGWRV